MINIETTKKLIDLEQELNKFNEELSNAFSKKYLDKIDETGAEFISFLKAKGLETSSRTDNNSSPQCKTFMATIGRIKFTLKCNYRSKSTSTEYFDLEMIDDNFAKSNQIIDIKPNKEIKGYYMEHKGTIEEKVSIAEKNIDKVKNLIPEVDTVTFQLSLRSGYNQNPDNIIPNISSFLKTKFA